MVDRIALPDALVPADAHVEISAKKAAGYYSPDAGPLGAIEAVGRPLDKY